MRIILRSLCSVVAGLSLTLGVACNRGPVVDKAVLEGASKLPGAADVMAAIDKKDYEGSLAALMKVKESVTTEEQEVQFKVLARQARDKITETAGADPKAAEVVTALRAVTTGVR